MNKPTVSSVVCTEPHLYLQDDRPIVRLLHYFEAHLIQLLCRIVIVPGRRSAHSLPSNAWGRALCAPPYRSRPLACTFASVVRSLSPPSEHPPPPGPLYALLSLYPIGPGLCPLRLLSDRLRRFSRLSESVQFSAEVVALPFGLFAPPALLIHPFAQRTLCHFAAGTFSVEFFAEFSQLAGREGALRGLSRL